MRYAVKRTPSGWWIVDTSKMVNGVPSMHPRIERHKNENDAQRSCNRLNGICNHCGLPTEECLFERDPNFGSDYDSEETSS